MRDRIKPGIDPMRHSSALSLLFGTTFVAAGYGATFLLPLHYKMHGGGETDASQAIFAALIGTLIGVPVVGWWSGRIDAPRLTALAAMAIACGYAIFSFAPLHSVFSTGFAGFLVGLGWGMFYIGAPMSLSERIADADRVTWFTRFSAFQMAGICGSPVLLGALMDRQATDTREALACVILVSVVGSILFLKFSIAAPIHRNTPTTRAWVRNLSAISRTEAIKPILMVGLGGCVFSGTMAFQAALTAGTRASASLFFLVYAATAITARLALAGRLARYSPLHATTSLLAIMVVGVTFLLGIPYSPAFHLLAAILTGLGYGLAYPAIQTWAVNRTDPKDRHSALCWFVLSYFVGIFGFPVIGQWILIKFGSTCLVLTIATIAASELAISASAMSSSSKTSLRGGIAPNRYQDR